MALAQQYIIDKVRARLGLSVQDMANSVIESAIEDGLRSYSRQKAVDIFGTLPLQADRQDYFIRDLVPFDGSDPEESVSEVRLLLYSPGTLLYDAISFDAELQKVVDADLLRSQFGGNVFDNPSLGRIYFTKLKEYRARFDINFEEFSTSQGKIIRLMRVPVSGSVAYWQGRGYWTIEEITDLDQEVFLLAVLAECAQARANQLAVMKSYSENAGVSMSPAFDYWNALADKYRLQFGAQFGQSAGVFSIG